MSEHEHYAWRLMKQQAIGQGSIILKGDPPPTQNQVAAVLRALADHTLLMHLNSPAVLSDGEDRAHLGAGWQAATAHGRFLQRMADSLATFDD